MLTAALLIAGLSALSYVGIKESIRVSAISALIEMGGLLIVIAVCAPYIGNPAVQYFEAPGILSIFSATALIFFAYIGFEGLANMTEDTRNASKVMPKALLLSILITTVLYVLVSIAAVSVAGSGVLASSGAPLATVTELALPGSSWLLSVIALIATGSTVLALLIIGSRMFYGMARNHSMPAVLGKTGKRKTPYVAIAAVMVLSIIPLLFGGLGTLALLTDMGIFIVYFFVNASLITLRYKMPRAKRSFRSPINIGRFPVLAFLGITTSLLMLLHFDAVVIYYQLVAVLAGFVVYVAFRKARNMDKERYARFFRKPIILMRSIVKSGTRYFNEPLI
ncbi:MAG: amino acid permease [Candidatus Aenigmarchaeota archaeon]|nr:amino acid permease [Candidatus Aenigmarchaeota archaeon]